MTMKRRALLYGLLGGGIFVTTSVRVVIADADAGEPQKQDRQVFAVEAFGANPFERYPLARCQGDCDLDSHCRGRLICFQRSRYEPVPGCEGGREDRTPTDYCVDPEDMTAQPQLSFLGINPPHSEFPLQGKISVFQRKRKEKIHKWHCIKR